jgi:hypothetical protein
LKIVNKANQKLNEYLIEISLQKENIKYQNNNENIYQDDDMKYMNQDMNEENSYTYLNLLSDSIGLLIF